MRYFHETSGFISLICQIYYFSFYQFSKKNIIFNLKLFLETQLRNYPYSNSLRIIENRNHIFRRISFCILALFRTEFISFAS